MKINRKWKLINIEEAMEKELHNAVVISEVTLDREDYHYLLRRIRGYASNKDESFKINRLWTYYPSMCLVLTVMVAIYDFDNRNLWDRFTEVTEISDQKQWKELFWSQAIRKKINLFSSDANRKYWYAIIGNAGIPYAGVPKLLEGVFFPANAAGLDEVDIYNRVRSNIFNSQKINKPYVRFLQMGNKVSLSLTHRIQQILRQGHRPFVKKYKGYIPNHILEAMDQYYDEHKVQHYHFHKPEIFFSDENAKLELIIPAVTVSDDEKALLEFNNFYWCIKSKKMYQNLQTERVIYSDSQKADFIPSINKIKIIPDDKYEIEMTAPKQLENVETFSSTISTKTPLVKNTKTNSFVSWKEFFEECDSSTNIDRRYSEISFVVNQKDLKSLIDQIEHAIIRKITLSDEWQGYTLVNIIAKEEEVVSFRGVSFILNKIYRPSELVGDVKDHIRSSEFHLFSKLPHVRVSLKNVEAIRSGDLNTIQLINQTDNEVSMKEIRDEDLIFKKGHYYLSMDDIDHKSYSSVAQYSVSMFGKLGFDEHMVFLRMSDFKVDLLENREVQIKVANGYTVYVNWPENQKVTYEDGIYFIQAAETGKLKITLHDENNKIKYDLILYPELCEVNLLNHDHTLLSRDRVLDLALWKKSKDALLKIDSTNPSFIKKYGDKFQIKVAGESEDKVINPSTNTIYVCRAIDLFNQNLNEEVTYTYRFSESENEKLLLKLKNKLIINDFEWFQDEQDLGKIRLTWSQPNYHNDKFLRIWSLHDPLQDFTDVPLKKRSKVRTQRFSYPGIYMLEWLEQSDKVYNKPRFKNHSYSILNAHASRSLAYYVLLYSDDLSDGAGYSENQLIELMERIHFLGEEYIQLLEENYYDCCDFGIRASGTMKGLNENHSLSEELQKVLSRITAVQELDHETFFHLIKHHLTPNFKESYSEIENNYTDHSQSLRIASSLSQQQLNIEIQRVKANKPFVKDFHIIKAIYQYFYDIKANHEYAQEIDSVMERYGEKINLIYNNVKFSYSNSKRKGLFNQIEQRDLRGIMDSKDDRRLYPYLITQLSLINRLVPEGKEPLIGQEGMNDVRSASKEIMRLNPLWILNDMVYISLFIKEVNSVEKKSFKNRDRSMNYTFKFR